MEKVTILLSGGLDSYIAYHYAKAKKYDPVALFVDFGQPYRLKEEEAIQRLGIPYEKVEVKGYIQKDVDPDNWIIPGRNLLLAFMGATRAKRVWVCALDGEMHKFARERDKSPEFYHMTSALFTYIFDIVRPETIVETPFQNMSKSEVVFWALNHGISKEDLKKTSTCYDGEVHNCGQCGTCFKRWIAMSNNHIEEKYETKPWTGKYARKTSIAIFNALDKKDFSHYSEKRCHETLAALLRAGIDIGKYAQESKGMIE